MARVRLVVCVTLPAKMIKGDNKTMTNINVKRVQPDKLDSEIEDKQVEGWQLVSRSDNMAIMKKPGKYGNFWVHAIILTFTWWTLGLCNAAYAFYVNGKTKAELHLKVE